MAAPVDQKATVTYTNTTASCCCDLKEENFCLYTHQYTTGADPSEVPTDNGNGLAWGIIRADDWPLLDGQGANAKVVGRVQGQHMALHNNNWNANFTIVFQDDKYKGSTLQVRGAWIPENPVEWSILGGTGQFTLAQGIVYGTTLSASGTERWMQLCFQVFYRPIVKPNMA